MSGYKTKSIVAAIDIGTTYSGYAFSFKDAYNSDPLKIYVNSPWNSGWFFTYKAPTVVLFDNTGNFHSFGYDAETKYAILSEEYTDIGWKYFRRFKMKLHERMNLRRNMMLLDDQGNRMPALDVFSEAIKYLKDHLMKRLRDEFTGLRGSDIHWVLTVPAIWHDGAKQFMKEAAAKAEIPRDQLTLALEPEAAVIYCKEFVVSKAINLEQRAKLQTFDPGSQFMVLDLGGTVDITVHEVQRDGTLKELHSPSGGPWGGTVVDKGINNFLDELFGKDLMEKFRDEYKADDLGIQRAIELKKMVYKGGDDTVKLNLTGAIFEFFEKETSTSFASTLQRTKFSRSVKRIGNMLQIGNEIFLQMFKSPKDSVVNHVENMLRKPELRNVKDIMMVGGFSECEIMRNAVKHAFPTMNIIVPEEPVLAVVKGAVIFGHNTDSISSRQLPFTNDILKSSFKDVETVGIDVPRNLEEIRKFIESGKLPSQKLLDEMCRIYEKKSQEITITCKAICEHIKSKHAAIAYVWAAYTIENPNRITFVVIVEHKSQGETTEPLSLDKLITYSFVSQYVGEFNSEGSEVLRQETSASEGLDEESYQKLQSCISRHSEDLMKRHKYLSIISACSNRSRGFGASWNLLPEKCIVLYVQKKSYIPIDEEPFETHYDGIPVDVREGAFIPFGRTAKDLLDPVKMGSQIGGDNYEGTLGFFIDHPQFGICGLTCAHVLLTRWEMTRLKIHHGGTLKWPLQEMCKNVYQPADKQSVLGHTVQVIYKEGSNENFGMELALFRITDRHPKSPDFPETGSNVATSIKYDSWRMCRTDRLNKKEDNHVIKFGSKTELSHGIIKFDTTSVKSLDAYPVLHEYAPIQLFKQIEVKARLNGIPFAEKGDSGAPVFVVEKNSQNKCIGIIEGGTSYGTVVVTPIVPILAELDVPCLKSFDTEQEFSNIQNRIDNLETQVQRIGSDMQKIKQLLLNHPQNFYSSMRNSPNDQDGHA